MCTVLVKYVISHVYDITMPVISLGREVLMSTKSWTQEIIPDPKEITAPGVRSFERPRRHVRVRTDSLGRPLPPSRSHIHPQDAKEPRMT